MCELLRESYYQPQGYPFFVQRSWSNKAAMAGTDPCVPPYDPSSYFYAAPVMPDTVNLPSLQATTKGVNIALNASATIPVSMIAQGSPGTWQVQAMDSTQITSGPPHLSFSWDKTSGAAGDTLHLTITKLRNDNENGAEVFAIFSHIGQRQTIYWGVVGHP
jgi:hypothetical protein